MQGVYGFLFIFKNFTFSYIHANIETYTCAHKCVYLHSENVYICTVKMYISVKRNTSHSDPLKIWLFVPAKKHSSVEATREHISTNWLHTYTTYIRNYIHTQLHTYTQCIRNYIHTHIHTHTKSIRAQHKAYSVWFYPARNREGGLWSNFARPFRYWDVLRAVKLGPNGIDCKTPSRTTFDCGPGELKTQFALHTWCVLQNTWEAFRRSSSCKLVQIRRWKSREISIYFASRGTYGWSKHTHTHTHTHTHVNIHAGWQDGWMRDSLQEIAIRSRWEACTRVQSRSHFASEAIQERQGVAVSAKRQRRAWCVCMYVFVYVCYVGLVKNNFAFCVYACMHACMYVCMLCRFSQGQRRFLCVRMYVYICVCAFVCMFA
jgi:hypothetical protein